MPQDVPLTKGLGHGRLSAADGDRSARTADSAAEDLSRLDAETVKTFLHWLFALERRADRPRGNSAKDNALTPPGSMAAARLTEGRTTNGGTFGHTKQDAHPSRPLLQGRGETGQAETEARQHILATATSKAEFTLVGQVSQRLISRRPGCFHSAEA